MNRKFIIAALAAMAMAGTAAPAAAWGVHHRASSRAAASYGFSVGVGDYGSGDYGYADNSYYGPNFA